MAMLKGANAPVAAVSVRVEVGRRSGAGVPGAEACVLLAAGGRSRSEADFVSAARPQHPSGAVRHEGSRTDGAMSVDALLVDLARLDPDIDAVVVAVLAAEEAFGADPGLYVQIADALDGTVIARFDGADASAGGAVVLGELYRRAGGWRFRAVGQGYGSGLAGLAGDFGLAADRLPAPGSRRSAPEPAPAAGPQAPGGSAAAPERTAGGPAGRPQQPQVRLAKVTLSKERPAVSLAKQGGSSGALRVNLNWRPADQPQGWARLLRPAQPAAIDLDLCALYELTSGRRGVVQALGNSFGSLRDEPYIRLDGDDRTGSVDTGENLTVNLDHSADFRRILVFVTIYEGARSFAGLNATTTLYPQHGAPIEFFLDECTVPSRVCALALITNEGGELVVRREARYLVAQRGVSPQRTVDQAYGWGMRWTPGRK